MWLAQIYFSVIVMVSVHSQTTPPPVQIGDMGCFLNPTTGVMNATMAIFKKTSRATKAFFTDANFNEFTGADCIWGGDGTDSNPFKITVQINTASHQPPTGKTSCGHQLVSATDLIYKWTVYSRMEFEKATAEDVVFTFECTAKELPSEISVTYAQNIVDEIPIPSQIGTPTLYFTSTPDLTPESVISNPVEIGSIFYMRLRFQPSGSSNPSAIDPALSTWGVYCRNLYAAPSSTNNYQYRRVDLLNNNGCPRSDLEFLRPARAFTGTRPAPGNLYYGTTGAIKAAKFDLSSAFPTGQSNTVYVVCEAELCWRPEDQMCIDRCAALTGTGRRRRSVQRSYLVVSNFTIADDNDVKDGRMVNTDKETGINNFLIPSVASVGGFIVLLLIVLAIVCCRIRRPDSSRYKQYNDSPSVTSDVSTKPPYYYKGDHSQVDKMTRVHPAFAYPAKY